MALKAVLLALSLAVAAHVVRADINDLHSDPNDPLHQQLNGDLNSVCNELLGQPCKKSPPPPSPTPPAPGSPPPPAQPPSSPPAPVPAPAPAPVLPPAPAATSNAIGSISLTTISGLPLTPAQIAILQGILQASIGNNGVVTLTAAVGRKLLQNNSLLFAIENVTSCAELIQALEALFASDPTGVNEFINEANSASPPVGLKPPAKIDYASCVGGDSGPVVFSSPPSGAPTGM